MSKKVLIKSTWVDNFIGFFSPVKKAQRLKGKYQSYFMETVGRKYDGATKGRRGHGWRAQGLSANSEIDSDLHTLRNRSRDLRRNNAYIFRAVQAITNNVTGTGIKVQINNKVKAKQKKLRNLWSSWADTTNIDYDGRMNISQMQNMIMDAVVESGEVIVRRWFTNDSQFPVKLQLLESDFINDSFSSFVDKETGNKIIQGIEFDPDGNRVAYHLYKTHPGNTNLRIVSGSFESIRVPAQDIIHIYRSDRPGQIRGVPWAAPVMLNVKDLDDYEDAQLIRQKIAACFTAFIKDMDTGDGLTESEIDDISNLEPGVIEKLSSGKDITFANPPTVQNYNEYITQMLHKVATGMGVSYEVLSGDLSQVNFSSARMGWLEFQRNIKNWQNNLIISQFLEETFKYFTELSVLSGMNLAGSTVKYIAPRREMIDPTKETAALVKGIRGGLHNLNDVLLELGKDPEEWIEQRKLDNEALDLAGIILDSDPRKVNTNGLSQNFDQTEEND